MQRHVTPLAIFAAATLWLAACASNAQVYIPFRAWDDKALNWNVLRWGYHDMLEDHIRRVAFEQNLDRAWPSDPTLVRRRQQEVREKLWRTFGLYLLKKVSLNPRVTGQIDRGTYVVQKLVYTSLPGVYVTGNVYVPKDGKAKHPAVFCPHGHWPNGRFQPEVQARCVGLANLGYVVLSIDKYGYGERKFTGHHDAFYLLPTGLTLEGLQIWDNMRGIDYLLSRPDVDPSRIGITGASGGGNQTMYTAALDTRIAAAVPTASVNTFDGLFFRGIGCVCEGTPNILRFADEWDVLALIAPRSLFIPANLLDPIFPVARAREAYFRAKKVFEALDAGDRIAIRHFYDKHSYNREVREAMYGWFEHVFRGKRFEPVHESPAWLPTEDFDALRALPPGGFPKDAKTLTDLAVEYTSRFTRPERFRSREQLQRYRKGLKQFLLDEVFGGFPSRDRAPLRLQIIDQTDYNGWHMEKWLFWSDWDVLIPGVFVAADKARGTLVLARRDGKTRSFIDNWVDIAHHLGLNVLTVDLCGIGETAEEERLLIQNGLVAGKPVLGEWVWDLIRCVDAVRTHETLQQKPIYLAGTGPVGLAAALVPLFDTEVHGICALETLGTYVTKDRYAVAWEYYLHRLLQKADVPQLMAAVAPTPLVLAGTVWPSAETISQDELPKLFAVTRSAYALHKAEKAFRPLEMGDFRTALQVLLESSR